MLYFKEGRYNWGDRFFVMDETGEKKYRVKSSVLLWKKKFEICDMDKNVLVTIQKDPKSLLKQKFFLFLGEEQRASNTKEISLIPKYTFEGLDWEMKGVMLHSYEMTSGAEAVLSFRQESLHRFVLDVAKASDELLALAVVMTITYVMNAGSDEAGAAKY